MVDLEAIAPATAPSAGDEAHRPVQRAPSVENNGMGDMLRFDAERLRILVERHQLYTGSKRAAELLADWDRALASFVKVMPTDYRRALLDLQAQREAAPVAAE
jgi:glutamate synthase (NADPH/NADH) large chain